MKTKLYVGAVLVGAMLFTVGRMTAGGGGLSQKTQENLSTAMHGEAFAYAKYMLYAKHAQQNGNAELAKLFQTAANIERFQHFAEEAQFAGLVGNDADNLKDATHGRPNHHRHVESWFRTHPPFYQRMVDTRREIMFLPAKPDVLVQTSAFEHMKKELAPIAAAANKEEMGKPSLKITREQGCEPPKRLEYKPGQPIEELCSAPARTVNGADQ